MALTALDAQQHRAGRDALLFCNGNGRYGALSCAPGAGRGAGKVLDRAVVSDAAYTAATASAVAATKIVEAARLVYVNLHGGAYDKEAWEASPARKAAVAKQDNATAKARRAVAAAAAPNMTPARAVARAAELEAAAAAAAPRKGKAAPPPLDDGLPRAPALSVAQLRSTHRVLKVKLFGHLRGTENERRQRQEVIKSLVEVAGVREARRAATVMNHAVVVACEGWIADDVDGKALGPPPFTVRVGFDGKAVYVPFEVAGQNGRAPTRKGDSNVPSIWGNVKIADSVIALCDGPRARHPRQEHDRDIIESESVSQCAAAYRGWQMGTIHGVRARALRNLEASSLRALVGVKHGVSITSLAKYLNMKVFGVTAYEAKQDDGTFKRTATTAPSSAIAELLEEEWAVDLVTAHRAELARGGGSAQQTEGTYGEASTWLNGGADWKDGDGWRAIRYLHFLLGQRREWISSEIDRPGEARAVEADARRRADGDVDGEPEPSDPTDDDMDEENESDDVDSEGEDAVEDSVGEWRGRMWYPRLFSLVPDRKSVV